MEEGEIEKERWRKGILRKGRWKKGRWREGRKTAKRETEEKKKLAYLLFPTLLQIPLDVFEFVFQLGDFRFHFRHFVLESHIFEIRLVVTLFQLSDQGLMVG